MIWAIGHRNARLEQRAGGAIAAPLTLTARAATLAIPIPVVSPVHVATSQPGLAAKPAGRSTAGAASNRTGGY